MAISIQSLSVYSLALLIFFSINAAATIRVAVFDTYFCQQNFKNISLINYSKQPLRKCPKNLPSAHGMQTLRLMDEHTKQKLEVIPIEVFDQAGKQKADYWLGALKILKDYQVNYLLIPLGLPYQKVAVDEKISNLTKTWKSLSIKTFVAAGQSGNGITAKTKLWPQELSSEENLVLIGSRYRSKSGELKTPTNQLYKSFIESYYELPYQQAFSGSSVAVTLYFLKVIGLKVKID